MVVKLALIRRMGVTSREILLEQLLAMEELLAKVQEARRIEHDKLVAVTEQFRMLREFYILLPDRDMEKIHTGDPSTMSPEEVAPGSVLATLLVAEVLEDKIWRAFSGPAWMPVRQVLKDGTVISEAQARIFAQVMGAFDYAYR